MQCDGWHGPCDRQDAVRYRMRTAYVNDESNYVNLCPSCQVKCDEHWDEMWAELEADIMEGIREGNRV